MFQFVIFGGINLSKHCWCFTARHFKSCCSEDIWHKLVSDGTQHNPRLQDFSLAKVPFRAGNKNTSHNSAESLRGFGILSPESKGGDCRSANSKALLKNIRVSFVQRQICSELLQGWGTGKVPRQGTPTSAETQYANDWKINQITWQIKMRFCDCKEAGIFLVIFSKPGRRDINMYGIRNGSRNVSLSFPVQMKCRKTTPPQRPLTEVMP